MSKDSGGFQATLRRVISGGNFDEIIDLMDDPEFDPDDRDKFHDLQTFLMKLCHLNLSPDEELDILDRLDYRGVDFAMCDTHGRTALIHACIGDNITIVQFITSRYPELWAKDNEGNNVLVYAIKNGNYDITEHILDCDRKSYALMSSQNNLGLTAIDFARRTENTALVKLLEDHMPTHPSVKNLRRSQERGKPCQPAPVQPPVNKSLSTVIPGPCRVPTRVPFHHSKSWDNDDRSKNGAKERNCYHMDAQQTQCTNHKYMRRSENDENSQVKLSGSETFPRIKKHANHADGTKLPEIVPKQSQRSGSVERKKVKKDSTSLPDLRHLNGSLVGRRTGSKGVSKSKESKPDNDDVFEPDTKSDSSIVKLPVLLDNNSRKAEKSRQGLARTRKKSSSVEDVMHTSVLF